MKFFKKINNLMSSVVDLRRLLGVFYIPRFISDYFRYRRLSSEKILMSDLQPCLSDWVSSTPFDPHYFYQSAWLARALNAGKPRSIHIDVGSDVRMIASISAFIPIKFVDFRPLKANLTNLNCVSGDITALEYPDQSVDSISSLHVIEHIGLGRYGDQINPQGSLLALDELRRVLAPGGRLYISIPVGRERVAYNAHRIFNPASIIDALKPLMLISFSLVNDRGEFFADASIDIGAAQDYGCGMFIFSR